MKTKELLIMEPHENFRTLFRTIIERQDWEVKVHEAQTREEGLSVLKKILPEIVFFDITLRSDRENLETEIKAIVPVCRVIVLIPFEEEMFARWHKTDDIEKFLSKDKLSERLIPTLQQYLEV